jgi:hypothetical protein
MKRNVPPNTEKNGSYELRPHAPQGVKEKKKKFSKTFCKKNAFKVYNLKAERTKNIVADLKLISFLY